MFKLDNYLKKQLLIAANLYLGHCIIGYTVAWSSPVIPKLQKYDESPLVDLISTTEAGWVGTAFTLGTIIGPQASGSLGNIIGRKLCLVLGGCLNILGSIVLAAARNLATIYVARALAGLGLGMVSVVQLYYLGEIASSNIRGILLTLTGVFHSVGCLFCYSIGPYISYGAMCYVLLVFSIVYVFGFLYMPESPLYHVIKGNEKDAKSTLCVLGRDKEIEKELRAMIENVQQTRTGQRIWRELFTIKSNRKAFLITVFCFIFQECSGVVTVIIFATSIFQSAGSSIDPAMATIIIGVTQLLGTIITPIFIDSFGRRTLLLISTFGCSACMTILGIYFYLDVIGYQAVNDFRWLPLVILIIDLLSYSLGLGVVPNTLVGEMYRPNVRSIGASTSMTTGWLFSFICNSSYGYIVVAVGIYLTFGIFAIINALAFAFVIVFVPETRGKTLIEIEAMLAK